MIVLSVEGRQLNWTLDTNISSEYWICYILHKNQEFDIEMVQIAYRRAENYVLSVHSINFRAYLKLHCSHFESDLHTQVYKHVYDMHTYKTYNSYIDSLSSERQLKTCCYRK